MSSSSVGADEDAKPGAPDARVTGGPGATAGDGPSGTGVKRPTSTLGSRFQATAMHAGRVIRMRARRVSNASVSTARPEDVLFGSLKLLSPVRDAYVRFGDILQAFRLSQFQLTYSVTQLSQRLNIESDAIREFQYHLGTISDLIRSSRESFAVAWSAARENHTLSKRELYDMYAYLHDPNTKHPSFMDNVAAFGAESVRRLHNLFFHNDVLALCASLNQMRQVFTTLFLHFEANTESGEQDASLSQTEILEMLQVLGFEPSELGLSDAHLEALQDEEDEAEEARTRSATSNPLLASITSPPTSPPKPASSRSIELRPTPGSRAAGGDPASDRITSVIGRALLRRRGDRSAAPSSGAGVQPEVSAQLASLAPTDMQLEITQMHLASQQADRERAALAGGATPAAAVQAAINTGPGAGPTNTSADAPFGRGFGPRASGAAAGGANPFPPDSAAARIHWHFEQRGGEDLDEAAFASLCLSLLYPAQALPANCEATASPQFAFALKLRHRLSLLYESAEGVETSIDWRKLCITLLTAIFFPASFLVVAFGLLYQQAVVGDVGRILASRVGSASFRRAFLYWIVGSLLWFSAVVPPTLYYSSADTECVTFFEALYPSIIIGVGAMAASTYIGYTARVIRPGDFKKHRLAVTLRRMAIVIRRFANGKDDVSSAMAFIKREHIIKRRSRVARYTGLRKLIAPSYIFELSAMGRSLWIGCLFLTMLVIALLPSSLRSTAGQSLDDARCSSFIPGSSEAIIASSYLVSAPICTVGLALVLVRMLVQFAHIRRSWVMFTSLHSPVLARQRKEYGYVIKATPKTGRLSGFADLRRPENVRAWSKIRLYMQLFFADEVRGAEILLAFTLLLMVVFLVVGMLLSIRPVVLGSQNRQLEFGSTRILLPVLAMMFTLPVLAVLATGVTINETLRTHRFILARQAYCLQEEREETAFALGEASASVRTLRAAHRLIQDIIVVLRDSDRPMRVFGVTLSMTIVQALGAALATTVSTSFARVAQGLVSRTPSKA